MCGLAALLRKQRLPGEASVLVGKREMSRDLLWLQQKLLSFHPAPSTDTISFWRRFWAGRFFICQLGTLEGSSGLMTMIATFCAGRKRERPCGGWSAYLPEWSWTAGTLRPAQVAGYPLLTQKVALCTSR